MKEHDIVLLKSSLNGLSAGATGTIVHEFVKGQMFIVEFCDMMGRTIALENVSGADLNLVKLSDPQ